MDAATPEKRDARPSAFSKLFYFMRPDKGKMALSLMMACIGETLGMVPYVVVAALAAGLVEGTLSLETAAWLAAAAAAGQTAKFLFTWRSSMMSHGIAFRALPVDARADGREDGSRAHGDDRRHADGDLQEPFRRQREPVGGRHRTLRSRASQQRVRPRARDGDRVRSRLENGAGGPRHDSSRRAVLPWHDARVQGEDGALHLKRAEDELDARRVRQRHPGHQGLRAERVIVRLVLRGRGRLSRLHARLVPSELGVDGACEVRRSLHAAVHASSGDPAPLGRRDRASRLHGVHLHPSGLHRGRSQVRAGGGPDLADGCVSERDLGLPGIARAVPSDGAGRSCLASRSPSRTCRSPTTRAPRCSMACPSTRNLAP